MNAILKNGRYTLETPSGVSLGFTAPIHTDNKEIGKLLVELGEMMMQAEHKPIPVCEKCEDFIWGEECLDQKTENELLSGIMARKKTRKSR